MPDSVPAESPASADPALDAHGKGIAPDVGVEIDINAHNLRWACVDIDIDIGR